MKIVFWCIVGILVLAVAYWSLAYLVGILTYLFPGAVIVCLVVFYFRYRARSGDALKTPERRIERRIERAAGRELRGMERKIKIGPEKPRE